MDILCNNVSHTKTDSSDGESTVEVETSLFEELDEALNLCTLVYTMTAMRRQVRENKITQGTRSIMQLPISIKNANELVLAEKHHLTLSKYAENKRAMSSIVQTLSDRQQVKSSSRRSRSNPRRVSDGSNSFITTFGDESGHNSLVYAISVNHERKIVTLAFRGMETDVDWAPLNTKVFMKEMPNPMKLHSSQASTVRIHNKLHEMLIVPTYRDTNADTWTKISEYHDLLEEQVIPTLIENPGYKLYVTGHSLGASLATLFAFLAAAEPDSMIPKPVTCISIGSSYIGDSSFRSAHQFLEGLKRLRHVRISNHKDPVTLTPKVSFRWNFFDKEGHGGTAFKHVGLNLRFYPGDAPFDVLYPMVRRNFIAKGFDEITRSWENSYLVTLTCNPGDYISWPLHQIREYNLRVMRSRKSLQATTVKDLYTDPIVVGNLFSNYKKLNVSLLHDL